MPHADVVTTLSAKDLDLQSKLTKGQQSITRFGQSTMGTLGVLKGAFALFTAGAIAKTVLHFTEMYAVQARAEKKLAAVLVATGNAAGFSAQQLKDYAAQLQKVTNYGDEVTISAMAVLATFKNIKGDQFKEATEAAMDMATVMGTDLQGAIMQVAKALQDPITGMKMMRRVGVSFTESQLDMAAKLQKTGDLMGAQKIILAELKGEFGGAARAMASPMTQMKNAIGDMGELIGKELSPAVVILFKHWTEGLQAVTDKTVSLGQETSTLYKISARFMDVLHTVKLIGQFVWTITKGIGQMLNLLAHFGMNWREMRNEGIEAGKAFEKAFLAKTPSEEMDKLRKKTEAAAAAGKGFTSVGEALDEVGESASRAGDKIKAVDDKIEKMVKHAIAFSQRQRELRGITEGLTGTNEMFPDYDEAQGKFNSFVETMTDRIRLTKGQVTDLKLEWEKIAKTNSLSDEQRASALDLMENLEAAKNAAAGPFETNRFPQQELAPWQKPGAIPAPEPPWAKAPDKNAATAAAAQNRTGSFEDIGSLYKRIATAAGGTGGDPQERTAKATERALTATEKQNIYLKEMADRLKNYTESKAIRAGEAQVGKMTAVFGA